MKTRIATGLVLGPTLLWLVYAGPWWAIATLLTAAAALTVNEFYKIVFANEVGTCGYERATGVALVVGIQAAVLLLGEAGLGLAAPAAAVIGLSAALLRTGDMSSVGKRATGVLAGVMYVGLLFAMILLFSALGEVRGRGAILLLFLTVWFADTAAYFAGRAIGGKKLYPKISPKKTWAGFFGAIGGSIGGAFLCQTLFAEQITLSALDCVALGVGVAIIEQVGDLCASLFKRSFGVKDSGALLPGHGGLLDRVDGLLFAAPYIYLWLKHSV